VSDGPAAASSTTLVQMVDLKKSYVVGDVTVHALRGVDLEIAKGTFLAVVGASGSGKSTFMNIAGLLDRPTSGRYLLEGQDVSEFDRDRRAQLRNRKIGFVFQNFNLLPRTSALENVELPMLYSPDAPAAGSRHAKAQGLLDVVGLGQRTHHTPSQLSGGQQQRVAIARALVNRPPLIFADEPTGALDSVTTRQVMELFCRLHEQGITVVLVTHDPAIAEWAERVVTFADGSIVSDRSSESRRAA